MTWQDSKLDALLEQLEQSDLSDSDRAQLFQEADARLARLGKRYQRLVNTLKETLADDADLSDPDEQIDSSQLSDDIQECLEAIEEQKPIGTIVNRVVEISRHLRCQIDASTDIHMVTADMELERLEMEQLVPSRNGRF